MVPGWLAMSQKQLYAMELYIYTAYCLPGSVLSIILFNLHNDPMWLLFLLIIRTNCKDVT